MLTTVRRFIGGHSSLPHGSGASPTLRSRFSRLLRILYIAIPLILLLNYLIIFNWAFFSSLPDQLWNSKSFHPAPFAQAPHEIESHDNEGGGGAGGLDYWTWDTTTQFKSPQTWNWTAEQLRGKECKLFPAEALDRIQVVLKVGAADHWSRTESQLSTIIKCIPNVLVASDLDHTYGRAHTTIDVLASLPPESYMKEEDYAVYETQKNASAGELTQGHDGWKIDKYKFLSEVEMAVANNSYAEWYVFLESDTYIFWDNVFRLLVNYDPKLPYYFGSPSPGKKIPDSDDTVWFAYGGCGFILSNAAAHRLVDRKRNTVGIKGPRVTDEYKEEIQNDCCGDSILGWALHDKASVDISGLWPMFNPHSLSGIPFGKLYWCEPVISLHKTGPDQFKPLWEWENARDRTQRPLLYADLLTHHRLGTFSRRENWDAADWDGFSEPDAHPAHTSLDACEQACKDNADCYQFTWHGHHCYMARSIRMGHHKDPDGEHEEEDRRYVSGWDVEKIKRWREENPCAEGAHWVRPSVKRRY